MQYENNLRKKCFLLSKTHDLVFKKPFQKVHLEKGGSSYIRGNTVIVAYIIL